MPREARQGLRCSHGIGHRDIPVDADKASLEVGVTAR